MRLWHYQLLMVFAAGSCGFYVNQDGVSFLLVELPVLYAFLGVLFQWWPKL